MDSSKKMISTPRRSTRLLQAVTPKSEPKVPKIVGPRMMMKLNKSLNKSRKLEDAEESTNEVVSENEAVEEDKMEDKMEVDEIEEDDKPKAKKSLKRGRKTKKSNTKSMLESSEIANDEKSNITEQETSPEVKDTTITSQNVVLNNATENVIIDESLALESPNKSIIKTEVATIVEDEKEKPEDSIITVKKEKIESIVEKINKVEETGSSEVVLVPVVSTTEVEEAPIVAVEEIEETKPVEEVTCSDEVQGAAPTFAENINETVDSVVEEITSEVAPVLAPADNSTDVVEAQVNSKEVVVEDSIASSNEVEKVEPVKQVNCSDEVQDVEPISKNDKEDEKNKLEEGMDCSDDVHKDTSITNIVEEVEKVEPVAEAMKEVQVVASSVAISEEVENVEPLEEINRTVEVLEPVKKFNEIEIILTEIKREKVEQEVPNKSSLKEVVTRKSESYTVEESKNIEERCESPDLMDESIVTIMDSPPPMNVSAHPKDSTFSPVVDISINDSRPTIDVPLLKRNNPLRTSTPLAPKLGLKSIAENQNSKRKLMLNPLEKSILKSNRRKRSLSMVEGDSFMQKRVMFISPTVMDIESIDHKMMASFIEEKENSIMVTAAASGRRKRSMSETNTTPRAKIVSRVKLPNFNKLHEKQFQKMEDIAEFTKRKAERAKKLATPTKPAAVPRIEVPKVVPMKDQLSKIPTFNKKPVSSELKIEKTVMQEYKSISNRLSKRSNSMVIEKKRSNEHLASKKVFKTEIPEKKGPGLAKRMKPPTTSLLMRANSENTHQRRQLQLKPSTSAFNQKPFDSKLAFSFLNNQDIATNFKKDVSKVQERQDKNMLLYKRNGFNPQEQRKKNENILIGVRKNRRFELQMQYRAKQEQEHNNDDN